jgi:hypothetical protein
MIVSTLTMIIVNIGRTMSRSDIQTGELKRKSKLRSGSPLDFFDVDNV